MHLPFFLVVVLFAAPCAAPPKANPEFKNQSVPLNSTLTMKCIVGGDPTLRVNWTKDGMHLATNNGTLTIDRVTFKDTGQYGCLAENSTGKFNTTIWIDVTESPQVSVSPTNQTVSEGKATNISCKITAGVPKPTLSWNFNNNSLPSVKLVSKTEDGSVLQIQNTKMNMAGTYMCTARNKLGEANATSTLRVLVPPKVNPEFKNQSVPLNSTLTMKCIVGGVPAPTVNWTKNGRHLFNNNDTLTIDRVTFNDGGQYGCLAENSAGKFNTTIWIDVTESPQVSVSPIDQTVPEGKATNIRCEITAGVPKPTLSWNFNNNSLPAVKLVSKTEDVSVLQMQKTKENMGGTYMCTARNKLGEANATSTLRVLVPPKVNPEFKNQSVPLNSTLTMKCIESGVPAPTVNWTKNGMHLANNNGTLTIDRVTFNDAGQYGCLAENRAGKFNTTIWIDVTVPPKANPEFKNQSVPLNSTLTMKCIVGGVPAPTVNWTKNGMHLANNNGTLTIDRVTFSDAGQYGCLAENRAGKFNTTIWIDVTESPQVSVVPTNQTVPEGKATNVSCKITAGVPKPTLFWSFNNNSLPSDTLVTKTENESVLQVHETKKNMGGTYMCKATNKVGAANATSTLRVFGPVRLNGADINYGGRVEVFYQGKWGRICRDEWDLKDVKVVCNELGFQGALAEITGSEVKEEKIPFLMSKVSCSGNESNLASCKRSDGEYNCSGDKGAQALCEPKNREVLDNKTHVADVGSSETIECSLNNETSSIQWFRDGKIVLTSGEKRKVSGSALTITDIQLSDGGTYQCSGEKYIRYYTIYMNAVFKGTPSSQTVINGTSGIIKCSAEGIPAPQFAEWKRVDNRTLDKRRFKHMPNGSLVVDSVRLEDKGNYVCTIKQNIGKGEERITTKSKIIDVSVVVPPKANPEFKNQSVPLNSTLTMKCIVGGVPAPIVNWTKNGVHLANNNGTLTIDRVTFNDAGQYGCLAENRAGKFNTTIWIDVTESPQVSVFPPNQTVTEGKATNISCKIRAGVPKPTLSWRFKSNSLPSDTLVTKTENGSVLQVHDTKKKMGGTYMCKATNKVGAANATSTLRVFGPVRLNGADINYGGRVEVFYQGKWGRICRDEWDLNDVKVVCNELGFQGALAEITGSEVKEEKIPFLMSKVSCSGNESNLASCKRSDGEYNCSGDKGAQALCEPKNREVLDNKTHVADVGSSETIECSLNNETSSIQWFRDGKIVLTSGEKRKVSGSALTITDIQLSDGGTYQCSGEKYIRYYTIYMNAVFKGTRSSQTVINGTSGIINCSAEGIPAPQFAEWKRVDNRTLDKRRFKHMPNGSLVVDSVRLEDKGNYVCTIKQNIGKGEERITTKSKIIDVSVVVRPKIQILGQNLTAREGDNVNLTCIINEGTPKPTIQWFKDGTSKDETKTVLYLTGVRVGDEGQYTCKAENGWGSSEDKIFVIVDIPPKINPNFKNQSVPLNSTLTMKCIVGGDPTPRVNWTKNGTHLANNNDTLTIDGVTFKDAGRYGCLAENRAGKVNQTIWIDVTVSPQVSVSPTNQTVHEDKATNISCKITAGVPKPTLSWSFKSLLSDRLPSDTPPTDTPSLPSDTLVTRTEYGSVLQVHDAKKDMEGTYECRATNKANAAVATATLGVLEKPTAKIKENSYPTISPGANIKLTCEVSASTVTVKWKKNNSSVTPRAQISRKGDESTLVIKNVRSDDSGDYSCEAHNEAGHTLSSTLEIKVRAAPSGGEPLKWEYIVGPIGGVIVLSLVTWGICKRRIKAKITAKSRSDEEQGIGLGDVNRVVDEWEISRDRLVLREVIGTGAFGAVWKAALSEPDGGRGKQIVAAKCFIPTAGADGRKALMREIELGKLLNVKPKPNIVKFLGCVTTQIHPIMVMEFLAYGDLLGYLRKSRGIHDKYHLGEGGAFELQPYDLVLFAKQIATGMVYLGSRGVVHRDLAARNVLLDRNFVCKVTDFGLAYQNFKYGHGNAKKGCIPVKWTAPEILYGNPAALSAKSDVWSYGVVLYEIFTIGGIPYPEWSEAKTIAEIRDGYRMPKPEHIDDTLYHLMLRCWEHNPDFRPPFEVIRQKMIKYIEQKMYISMLDMSHYDGTKYSKVEDIVAEDRPSEQAAGPSNKPVPPPRSKWATARK